jgi:hypothetical protein
MTEAEWLGCTDPTPMMKHLRSKASARKLRLFACASCRLVWHMLIDERSRAAVETAEHLADEVLPRDDAEEVFSGACTASRAVRQSLNVPPETILNLRRRDDPDTLWRAAFMAAFAVGNGVVDIQAHIRSAKADLVGGPMRSRLLRDIFGNPFQPVAVVPAWTAWNNSPVPELARSFYDERAFDRLPDLADALEEAGCTDADILTHLRGPGPHVRGCWVVDLLLGKA